MVAPVLVSRGRDLSHAWLHPLGLNQLLNVGVDQWLQIRIVDTCQWVFILVGSRLLVGPLFHFPQCHSGLLFGAFTINCLQTGHWVRVDHYILMDWGHVLVIVQCQTDSCSLSHKDGAVAWQSFGQLAAGYLIILEMVVDDRRCPIPGEPANSKPI